MGGLCTKIDDVEEESREEENFREEESRLPRTKIQVRQKRSKLSFNHGGGFRGPDSSSSEEDDDDMPMPMTSKRVKYIVGMDLDTGGKGVGVFFMNQVKIISGNFLKMQASGLALSFYRSMGKMKTNRVRRSLNSLFLLGKEKLDRENCILDYALELWPKQCVEVEVMGGETFIKVVNDGYQKLLSAEDILSESVKKMKQDSVKFLRKKIKETVAVVPTNLRYHERQNLVRVFSKVGLRIERIISGTTSTALYYGYKHHKGDVNLRTFLVVDFGNSCLNVSLVKLQFGIYETVENLCRRDLSGMELSNTLVDFVIQRIKEDYPDVPVDGERARLSILSKCKPLMSKLCKADPPVEYPLVEKIEGVELELSQTMVKRALQGKYHEAIDAVEALLEKELSKQNPIVQSVEKVDQVLVVGEYSHFSPFKDYIADAFEGKMREKIKMMDESSIAYGSALLGANLQGSIKFILVETVSFSLGVEVGGGSEAEGKKHIKLVNRGTTVPTEKKILLQCKSGSKSGVSLVFVEYDQDEAIHSLEDRRMDVFNFDGLPAMDSVVEVTVRVSTKETFEVFANCNTGKGKKRLLLQETKKVLYPIPVCEVKQ